jgi:hypothetical protein
MIDAEEAEARARAAAEADEAHARAEALAAAARQRAWREAAEQARIHTRETEQRRAETLFARAAKTKPEAAPSAALETFQPPPITVKNLAPRALEEAARTNGRPNLKEEFRARKAVAKADKQASKQAAQRIASLEKKEARERKALAKAAARRRTA